MTQRKNNEESKSRKKDSKNIKVRSSKNDEDFDTGSHSPSSVRKVGAGYDDTGKGMVYKHQRGADKSVQDRQRRRKKNIND
jgi:hypothetical protein